MLRRSEAPIAELPIPASHAKIIRFTESVEIVENSGEAATACPFACAFAAVVAAWAASSDPSSELSSFKMNEPTTNDTAAATNTPANTTKWGMNPLGAIPKIAMIEPGEAAEVNPAPNNWNVNVPDTPPAITARNIAGFIITYGK